MEKRIIKYIKLLHVSLFKKKNLVNELTDAEPGRLAEFCG